MLVETVLTFSNPRNRSGVSHGVRRVPPNANTVEAYGVHVLKCKLATEHVSILLVGCH